MDPLNRSQFFRHESKFHFGNKLFPLLSFQVCTVPSWLVQWQCALCPDQIQEAVPLRWNRSRGNISRYVYSTMNVYCIFGTLGSWFAFIWAPPSALKPHQKLHVALPSVQHSTCYAVCQLRLRNIPQDLFVFIFQFILISSTIELSMLCTECCLNVLLLQINMMQVRSHLLNLTTKTFVSKCSILIGCWHITFLKNTHSWITYIGFEPHICEIFFFFFLLLDLDLAKNV